MTEADRRQYPRFPMRLLLSYRIANTTKLGKSLTRDIGGVGVRFIAEHPLEVGTQLEVVLRLLSREEPIRFVGRVIWSKPRGQKDKAIAGQEAEVGVEFMQIDPKDRALVLQEGALYGLPPEETG